MSIADAETRTYRANIEARVLLSRACAGESPLITRPGALHWASMPVSVPVIEDDPLPDEPLYHYTDAGGLHGILEKEALWATHAAYLNDSQEFVFGIQKIEAELRQLAQHPPDEAKGAWDPNLPEWAIQPAIQLAISGLGARLGKATVSLRENLGPYVTCLSQSEDQLSQWRGYGQGGGYSIRFNTHKLRESVRDHNADHRVVRMRYEKRGEFDPSLREAIIQFIKDVAPTLPGTPGTWDDDPDRPRRIEDVMNPVLDSLLSKATRQKHWGFREEKEYRVIAFSTADFHRAQDTGLIPRMNITFDPPCIEEIMIGPGQHMETREASVRSYIQKHSDRYQHVKVTSSETPFTGI
ncbi:DUF2971 domain-containing protein [Mycobacterium sp. 050128]|uniref:DUF2971 domain-containing protein n=1 Tax=Mycobacterium sp. 050128 TaxID=3096112 RepID=UPI002EDB09A0